MPHAAPQARLSLRSSRSATRLQRLAPGPGALSSAGVGRCAGPRSHWQAAPTHSPHSRGNPNVEGEPRYTCRLCGGPTCPHGARPPTSRPRAKGVPRQRRVEEGKGTVRSRSRSAAGGCRARTRLQEPGEAGGSGLQQSLAGIRLGAQSDAVMGGRGPARGKPQGEGLTVWGRVWFGILVCHGGCEDTLPRAPKVGVENSVHPQRPVPPSLPPPLLMRTALGW